MSNKLFFPLIGLGTWKLWGEECERVVKEALELGYRHIDTADSYDNHKVIGKSIKSFARDKLFLTSKLWLDELNPQEVEEHVQRFLKELDTDYLDLLLIHWPNPKVDLTKTLEAMVKVKEKGLTHHIGVSNFVREHLEMLSCFPIFTNQIEFHPLFQRKKLIKAYKEQGIKITAYRPVAKGAFEENETFKKIAKKHKKTPSQIALKWIIDQDIAVIPKASSQKHLKDNLSILDITLDLEDLKDIESLDSGTRFCAPVGLPILED